MIRSQCPPMNRGPFGRPTKKRAVASRVGSRPGAHKLRRRYTRVSGAKISPCRFTYSTRSAAGSPCSRATSLSDFVGRSRDLLKFSLSPRSAAPSSANRSRRSNPELNSTPPFQSGAVPGWDSSIGYTPKNALAFHCLHGG